MTKKNYFMFVGVFGLIVLIISNSSGDSWILAGVIVLGIILLNVLKLRVNEILDDERAYKISEKAARVAFMVIGITGGIGSTILALLNTTGKLLLISKTIFISLGFMFATYLISYLYYSKRF